MARIAVIGWGSLIWDMDGLERHTAGDWRMGHGPRLPLEFSRVSAKRLGGLAVCIDPDHGEPCATHVIASVRDDVTAAVADLASRERAMPGRIGMVWPACGLARSRVRGVADAVAGWCAAAGWDGAVWTDLEANFAAETGRAFSLAEAERHLAGLTGASRAEAVRYIHNAPGLTDTPLRRHLSGRGWWAEAVRALERT